MPWTVEIAKDVRVQVLKNYVYPQQKPAAPAPAPSKETEQKAADAKK